MGVCSKVLTVYGPYGPCRHLRVWREDGGDGIPWDHLQQLKDHALGAETWAVEVYPPAERVVNEINMRHLWEVPAGHVPDLYH